VWKRAGRYEFTKEFDRNMETAFEPAYFKFSKTEDAKAIAKGQIKDYFRSDSGVRLADEMVTGYFKRRTHLIVWQVTTLAAVLTSLGAGLAWLKAHVQLKKNGNGNQKD
jgi:hypothetical protein